jgi:hypothetical protein
MMNPRLEELIIWFLELGQIGIIAYGLVGGVFLLAVAYSQLKDSEFGKVIVSVLPVMFVPTMIRLALVSAPEEVLVMFPPILMNNLNLFYVLPVLMVLLKTWGALFE